MFTRSDQGHVVDPIASRTISAVIEVYYTSAPSATVSAALEKLIEACNNNPSMRSSLLSSCISLAVVLACFYIFTRIILIQVCRHVQNLAARCHSTSQKTSSRTVGSTNRSANDTSMSISTNGDERHCPNNIIVSSVDEALDSTEQATLNKQRAKSGKVYTCKWRPPRYHPKTRSSRKHAT